MRPRADYAGSELGSGVLLRARAVPAGPDVLALPGGAARAAETLPASIGAHVAKHLWTSPHRPVHVIPDRPDLSAPHGPSVPAAPSHLRRSARADR